MFVVIFEVTPRPGKQQEYLDLAASLRPVLERADGFISVERFASLSTEGKILSVSFWRDEAAVIAWREQLQHHAAQAKGRVSIFDDYRIRVAEVVRDYGMFDRAEAPQQFPPAERRSA